MKDVCVTYEARPLRRLNTTTKRCIYDRSLFVVLLLTILAQFTQHTSAAALPQQVRDDSDSLESAEDTLNLLHEFAPFVHREYNAGEDDDEHVLYKRHHADWTLDKHNDDLAWQHVCGHDSAWSGDELAEDLSQDYIKLVSGHLKCARK